MKGKAVFTPFLLQIMRFPPSPHQGLELPLAPPLHRKERGAKVSRWARHALGDVCPGARAFPAKRKLCVPPAQVPCALLCTWHPPALSHAHAGSGFFFPDMFIRGLRKGMVFCFKTPQLQGQLPESGLIWLFLLLFLPSVVGSMVRVRMHMPLTY